MATYGATSTDYLNSHVRIRSVSNAADVEKNHSITLEWDYNVLNPSDVCDLYIYRAVFPYDLVVDINSSYSQNRFKLIYEWHKGLGTASAITSYTDFFEWTGSPKSNDLFQDFDGDHASYTLDDFNDRMVEIAHARRAIYYKVEATSNRMSRNATPLGFFCDGSSVVALSERNQVVNNKFYKEGGEVWKTSADGKKFVRIAVDLRQGDIKNRRVWATTTTGDVYVFDYWTGNILATKSVSTKSILAMSYDVLNDALICHDGNLGLWKLRYLNKTIIDVMHKDNIVVAPGDYNMERGGFEYRTTGGVCVCVIDNFITNDCHSEFYLIVNNETVQVFDTGKMAFIKEIPRTHFGCTDKNEDAALVVNGQSIKIGIGRTRANQNNIYGICAGINGQVWVNGHTPISYSYLVKKDSGNPIHVSMAISGICREWGLLNDSNQKSDNNALELWNAGSTGHEPVAGYVYGDSHKLNIKNCDGVGRKVWDYSARLGGETRSVEYCKKVSYNPGCKFGIAGQRGVDWINNRIKAFPERDQRTIAPGSKITLDSVKKYPMDGPTNSVDVITKIHQELVRVWDDPADFDGAKAETLQDENYIYGCTSGWNYWTSNGQFEDAQKQFSANNPFDYRSDITVGSAADQVSFDALQRNEDVAFDRFHTTTILTRGADYGFIGEPNVFNAAVVDITVGKPFFLNWSNSYTGMISADDSLDLPQSIAGICSRLPADGTLSSLSTVECSFNVVESDKRDHNLGVLNYTREGNYNDVITSAFNRNLEFPVYTSLPDVSGVVVSKVDEDDYYGASVDSDNNVWSIGTKYIGKTNLLPSDVRVDKYSYDDNQEGSLNNTYTEVEQCLLYKFATVGIDSMKNGDTVELVEASTKYAGMGGGWKIADNKAYLYNCDSNSTESGKWADCLSTCRKNMKLYTKTNSNADETAEYNDDNFGINYIIQMSKVDIGDSVGHPSMQDPTARTRISNAVSKSDSFCDLVDTSSFWDSQTKIYNGNMSVSGFDNLYTTHQVYDINTGSYDVSGIQYEYTDSTMPISAVQYEYFENPESVNEWIVKDHTDELYHWLTPNYTGFVPPYGDINFLVPERAYTVDISLLRSRDVYSRYADFSNVPILVGTHTVHVFERWPTAEFCVSGVGGNSISADGVETGLDFWGDC